MTRAFAGATTPAAARCVPQEQRPRLRPAGLTFTSLPDGATFTGRHRNPAVGLITAPGRSGPR